MSGWNLRARQDGHGLSSQDAAILAHRLGVQRRERQRRESDPPPATPFKNPKRRAGPSHRPAAGARVSKATGSGEKPRRPGQRLERLPRQSNRDREVEIKRLLQLRKALLCGEPKNRKERRLHRAMLHRNGLELAEQGYRLPR